MFHHTLKYYEPGETIHAANWGRVIRGVGVHHRLWPREQVWEEVRLAVAPDAPSRLTCAFAYDDLPTAIRNRPIEPIGFVPWLYEVDASRSDAPTHSADLEILEIYLRELLAGQMSTDRAVELATAYWGGERPSGNLEVLVGSDLRVKQIVSAGYLPQESADAEMPPGTDYQRG